LEEKVIKHGHPNLLLDQPEEETGEQLEPQIEGIDDEQAFLLTKRPAMERVEE